MLNFLFSRTGSLILFFIIAAVILFYAYKAIWKKTNKNRFVYMTAVVFAVVLILPLVMEQVSSMVKPAALRANTATMTVPVEI